MNINEELDKIEKELDEDSLAPLVTKYHGIMRKSLMDLRSLAGENPKSQALIIKIAGDIKKLTGIMKRDLKKRK